MWGLPEGEGAVGQIGEGKGGTNGGGRRLNLSWWTHNTIYRWCTIELYTGKLCNFINQCHPIHSIKNYNEILNTFVLVLWSFSVTVRKLSVAGPIQRVMFQSHGVSIGLGICKASRHPGKGEKWSVTQRVHFTYMPAYPCDFSLGFPFRGFDIV